MKKGASIGDVVIDATVGNGNDTLFLSSLVGSSGKVFGFDIQKEALERTLARLQKDKADENVQLFHSGHENLKELLPMKCLEK